MSASKRDLLVQRALDVFYANGFRATGMDALAAATGVTKASMYKHFRTKEDLILAVLRLRDERFRNWLIRRVEELADTPRGRLLALFDALGEWLALPEFKSCMFIKAASEYQERDHPIHATAAQHKLLLRGHVTGLAQAAGAVEPERLARQLMLLQEGAIVSAHLHGAGTAAADARQAAEALIAAALPG
jgi:AcrR family transcriptional regulator